MNWTPVTSSNVAAVAHDPETQRLSVRFKSGKVYHYADVPSSVASGLIDADSPGGYLRSEIIGTYDHSVD